MAVNIASAMLILCEKLCDINKPKITNNINLEYVYHNSDIFNKDDDRLGKTPIPTDINKEKDFPLATKYFFITSKCLHYFILPMMIEHRSLLRSFQYYEHMPDSPMKSPQLDLILQKALTIESYIYRDDLITLIVQFLNLEAFKILELIGKDEPELPLESVSVLFENLPQMMVEDMLDLLDFIAKYIYFLFYLLYMLFYPLFFLFSLSSSLLLLSLFVPLFVPLIFLPFFLPSFFHFLIYLLLYRHNGSVLDACDIRSILQLITLLIASPSIISNCHIRAKFGDVLFSCFTPQNIPKGYEDTSPKTTSTMLSSNPYCQKYIPPALLELYGDVEHTGFYDKVEHRYKIALIVKFIWNNERHRDSFKKIGEDHVLIILFYSISSSFFLLSFSYILYLYRIPLYVLQMV